MESASLPSGYSTQARYLFELYTGADAVANLQTLPTQQPKAFETERLDFKSGKVRDEDIKHIWSKALGAFANNEGGVVVWGIRADKDQATGVDAAHAIEPVPHVEKLVTRLKELYPLATDPPIRGVEIQPVLLPGAAPAGFVVCFIPESDSKPHRSEFSKNEGKRFNLRMGDTTQECSVSILRQLFYPKINQRIIVEIEAMSAPPRLGQTTLREFDNPIPIVRQDHVSMLIRCVGRSSIHDPLIRIECGSVRLLTFEYNKFEAKFDVEFPNPVITLTRILHPQLASKVQFIVSLRKGELSPDWKFTFYARDLMPKEGVISHDLVMQKPWETRVIEFL